MRTNDKLTLRSIGKSHFVVNPNETNIDLADIYRMNAPAAFLWEEMRGRDFTADDMVQALTARFDVDDVTAKQDVEEMLATWKEYGLVK